jgi:putative phage-type endonuclease
MSLQRTDDWYRARLGKVTASRMGDLLATTRSGFGASRANYMAELLVERLTGVPTEKFASSAMAWGTEKEPDARAAYEFELGVEVSEVGFIDHPTIAMAGASPDGLVGDDGLIEIKCPQTPAHLDLLLGHKIPQKYEQQMQFQMACTGRQWCDFVSFDPRLPPDLRLFIKSVPRDDAMITAMEKEVTDFLAELDAKIAHLKSKFARAA